MVYSQRTPPRETPEEADRRPGRESGEAAGGTVLRAEERRRQNVAAEVYAVQLLPCRVPPGILIPEMLAICSEAEREGPGKGSGKVQTAGSEGGWSVSAAGGAKRSARSISASVR